MKTLAHVQGVTVWLDRAMIEGWTFLRSGPVSAPRPSSG